ncbi:DUF4136 domain-containing protein [Luteimonas sp. BDR2-5]|uniref:DUF4136 domain-containing protein n=1 Tax=Proluteimonas luteida TaxID=2878685 RepID=UPI001E64FB5D|nr:DUF4136 domain-containing protein [Luteimonas sp. BDR2-5]MCD9029674.1 DUF4136 domain-containing protein [Luteimonas sp. BDR2-5]
MSTKPSRSRRLAVWLAGLCALVLLAGCATGPRITTEADPRADFSAYRTWSFYSPLAIESEGYETATSEITKAAVRTEMERRGYTYSEDAPDLWVNINAYMERRTDVSSYPTVDYAYYYSYRHRGYFAVPYWNERTQVYRYTEGTMNVDLVDARQKRLVWEGVAVGRVANLKPEQRAARINSTIAEIFASYPHQAGTPGATL